MTCSKQTSEMKNKWEQPNVEDTVYYLITTRPITISCQQLHIFNGWGKLFTVKEGEFSASTSLYSHVPIL